jgi:hypothetical protein
MVKKRLEHFTGGEIWAILRPVCVKFDPTQNIPIFDIILVVMVLEYLGLFMDDEK